MIYLWLKTFHLVFVVAWFAALFYLPRLFVYHAMTEDRMGHDRFVIMERKLFGMMTLSMGLAAGFGIALLIMNPAWLTMGWIHAKLALVALLLGYHAYCWKLSRVFARRENQRTHTWYRVFNELPVLLLVAIIALAVIKPF